MADDTAVPDEVAPEIPADRGDAPAGSLALKSDAIEPDLKDSEADPRVRTPDGKFAPKEKEPEEIKVPKARFDEQVGRERAAREAAERQTAALQEQLREKGVTVDIDAAVQKVRAIRREQETALFDGDKEKAADLADQADDLNRRIGEEKATIRAQDVQRRMEANTETERVNATIEQLETDHPQLAEGHELFDQELVNFTLAEQNRLIAEERLSPSKALIKAATTVMKRFGTIEAAPVKTGLAAAQTDRKAAQVAKNLDTSKKQPGSMKEIGLDSDKAGTSQVAEEDAAKMSYEEFSALPDSTRAKMRGDYLAA